MTTAGRAEVIEGDYVRGDGTLCGTLAAWSRRVGPVVFQTWQSAFWTIRRNPEIIDEEAEEEESRQSLGQRMKRYYREIQSHVHGLEHQVNALGSADQSRGRSSERARAPPVGSASRISSKGAAMLINKPHRSFV